MTGTNYAIAAVMAVSCFLALMGAPLPWLVVNTGFGNASESGLSGEIGSPGAYSLIPALVVTALFVITLITRRWGLLVKIGLILFSVIVTLVGIVFAGVMLAADGGIGAGLWMTLWGGIGMLAASIWGSAKWNAAISSTS